MPTWGEILAEMEASRATTPNGQPDFDGIRRRYVKAVASTTSRDVIVYATNWLKVGGPGVSITLEDMQGMMEVCNGLEGPNLDLILHSPGGSGEAAASIVRYLRRKFPYIRVFVPLAAMSAATMWALAGDRIVMGKHSQLGPIDPQILIGQAYVPARALIREFDRAKAEIAERPGVLGAWMPRLQMYGPAMIEQCEAAEELGVGLVKEWLARYMLAGSPNAGRRASRIARYFADYTRHRSHSMGIDRDQARSVGVAVDDLEADQQLQDAVLSAYHATIQTFSGGAFKIIENQNGRAFIQSAQAIQLPMQFPFPVPQMPPPAG